MEQYKHQTVEITEAMQNHFDEQNTVQDGAVDATQRRITALEETVVRQSNQIRDLQSMIQHLQFNRK
jgi:polyhydroxyalkanoate synthesis regulator phasin